MQIYTASPTRSDDTEHDAFRFDVSALVCSTSPIKFVLTGDNRYVSIMTIDMSDAELDQLIDAALTARAKRSEQKVATLTALMESTYDAGAISMETAEKMQFLSNGILADRTDPDGDFPEIPFHTDDDAPEEV